MIVKKRLISVEETKAIIDDVAIDVQSERNEPAIVAASGNNKKG